MTRYRGGPHEFMDRWCGRASRILLGGLACLAVLLISSTAPALAGAEEDLYAAMDLERVSGDLAGALELYRRAAATGSPEVIPVARLGEGRCLRRLNRIDEAREVLLTLKETEVAAAAERELKKLAGPARESADPGPEAPMESPAAAKARDQESRAALAKWYLSQARAVYREDRIDEAREWLRRALEVEPTNPAARELLLRLGDAPDDRGRLLREVFSLLDMERRLRLDELTLRADTLLSAGEDLLLQGSFDAAVQRFDECIALLDASPTFEFDLSVRRERAVEFRDRAVLRGGRTPDTAVPAPPPTPALTERWRETLRELLLDLSSPRRPGDRLLRIYDLSGFAGRAREVVENSGQLALTGEHPFPGEFLTGLLPKLLSESVAARDGWEAGDHLLRAQGTDLLLYAPETVQDEVRSILTRVGTRQDPAARLTITAVAAAPQSLARAAEVAEARFELQGSGAWAALTGEQYERLLEILTRREHAETLGHLQVTVAPERTIEVEQTRVLNFEAPPGADGEPVLADLRYGYSAALLPVWTARGFGLAVRASTRVPGESLRLPAATTGAFRVPSLATETIEAAAVVPPGGALVLAGLANPFEQRSLAGRRSLVLLISPARSPETPEAPEAPADPDRPSAKPPDSTGPDSADPQSPLAVDLGDLFLRIGDEPAPPFRGSPPFPGESRTGFLLSWLAEAIGGELRGHAGNSLTIGQGVVWVHGDAKFKQQVEALVKRLVAHSREVVNLRIRAARISSREEDRLFRGLSPAGRVVRGEGVRIHLLKGDERRRLVYEIAGAEGRLSLLPRLADAQSTQLVNVSRVTTSRYLRGHAAEGGISQPIYDLVDEGLVVELRPIILEEGVIDLTVGIRVARILDRGPAGAAPGTPGSDRPLQAISSAEVRVALTGEETLMIAGIPAPTPTRDDQDRLILLVETAK